MAASTASTIPPTAARVRPTTWTTRSAVFSAGEQIVLDHVQLVRRADLDEHVLQIA
jgi:hypothetical protein